MEFDNSINNSLQSHQRPICFTCRFVWKVVLIHNTMLCQSTSYNKEFATNHAVFYIVVLVCNVLLLLHYRTVACRKDWRGVVCCIIIIRLGLAGRVCTVERRASQATSATETWQQRISGACQQLTAQLRSSHHSLCDHFTTVLLLNEQCFLDYSDNSCLLLSQRSILLRNLLALSIFYSVFLIITV